MSLLGRFLHPLTQMLRFSSKIRNYVKIKYEKYFLERPYIGNQLDYSFKNWRKERAVIIKAPTGAGKTWFVIKKIVSWVISKNKNILIITNRSPLNLSYKKEIAKMTRLYNCYTNEGLQQICEFGNVFVVNYQGLENFIVSHKHIDFSYVICDECHYFIQDATFTDCTGRAIDIIPKEYANAVRIYISATIDEVLPYITRAELRECTVDNDGNCWYVDQRNGNTHSLNNLIPIVYQMESDYSKVNLHFFESTDYLIGFLKNQLSKTLAFCNSKKECADFVKLMGGGLAISSEFLRENPEELKKLVETESFEKKCLCSTTVFSNGNNICDSTVKSVVITLTDPTEIVQMAGRRRLDYSDETDGFDLYLKIPELGHIMQNIIYIKELQEEIDKCKKNYNYLLDVIKGGNDKRANIIRSIFRVNRQTQRYEINYLCEEKLYSNLYYLEYIYALIKESGKEAYCEMMAKLFDKEFNNNMIFGSLDLRKKELSDFIMEYGFPLTPGQFEEFCEDFLGERIRLIGSCKADNFGVNRKTPASKSINNRLAELDLGIEIVRENNMYYIKENKDEVIL